MRVPSFERFQRLSAAGAYFVCGMVVGAAVWSGLANAEFNQAVELNLKLQQKIENYEEEIRQLNSDRRKESVIRSIVVFIAEREGTQPVDIVTEMELKKRLKEDLAEFRGRRIYNIAEDAAFAKKLLEKKIYAGIGANDYAVRITTMLVADGVLQVWAEASVHLSP